MCIPPEQRQNVFDMVFQELQHASYANYPTYEGATSGLDWVVRLRMGSVQEPRLKPTFFEIYIGVSTNAPTPKNHTPLNPQGLGYHQGTTFQQSFPVGCLVRPKCAPVQNSTAQNFGPQGRPIAPQCHQSRQGGAGTSGANPRGVLVGRRGCYTFTVWVFVIFVTPQNPFWE